VPGQIADVVCESDSTQSYALYLPSTYTPAKPWPIIYFFDPAGRGRHPLDLYKQIAEKYGFIFAGSNNSRNFSSDQWKSVNAIWQDTHARLALDEHRIYTSGFSGGARVAGAMALSCPKCQIAGVIAHGAGYPSNQAGSPDKLLYFFAIGDHDFNWPEVMKIRREREERDQPYRVHAFPGPHQWAPPQVMDDALQWLVLKTMQARQVPQDQVFIQHQYQQTLEQAADAEKRKDPLDQLTAYRSLTSDFAGLRDVSEAQKKLVALKNSAAMKTAWKNEEKQIADQYDLESEISPKLRVYVDGTAADLSSLQIEILQSMARLKSEADHGRDEARRLIFSRAFEDLWVEGIAGGQQELQAGHFEKAENCFDLMSRVRDDPWPFLLLARTHAAAGKSKRAIADLQQAQRRGFKDAEALASDEQLQVLNADPAFQKFLSELKQNSGHRP
jgi:dienelactone hydrolase